MRGTGMDATAIIFSGGKGDAATPTRDLNIGGFNPARRIVHALHRAGCTRAFIAADTLQSMAPAALSRDAEGLDVTIVPTGNPFELPESEACLLLPGDLLVDQRILAALLADSAPCLIAANPKDAA